MDQTPSPSRPYSLRKSRSVMKWVYAWYKKKGYTLSPSTLNSFENEMMTLDRSLIHQDKQEASLVAHRLEEFADHHCKKSFFDYVKEISIALLFALVIAVFVRQMWFELYEIPTGSMRPTFLEQDRLTVTKTVFGINYPLETTHLYFDPSLVQRSSILIFSGDKIEALDSDTSYFGLFSYKKRYIKRCIGKPGDSLYFYGGKIFGIDKEGNDLTELRDTPWMKNLEYVPMLNFEGTISSGNDHTVFFKQMNQPAGKLNFTPTGLMTGEVFNGKTWVKDQPLAQTKPHESIETYSDLYGMRNYAVARLLTQEELKQFPDIDVEGLDKGVLYLQLHHTPSLNYPKPLIQKESRGVSIGLLAYSTIIPLQQQHLDAIMSNLYTTRFVVSDGKATRYSVEGSHFGMGSPRLENVENGTYEFYFGKATKIHWGGIATEVAKENPLYDTNPKNVQKFFNLGIEMSTAYSPRPANQTLFPHRYAYFREGDLYLMGVPVLKKEDPTLINFLKREEQRQSKSSQKSPYVAFHDYGSPLVDGKINQDFIRTFGITVPEGHYFVLGDNHAMSSDSRVFGFIPQANLQGAPCWIIWPPSERLGNPPQKPYPLMNTPRMIVWMVVGLIALVWYLYYRRQLRRPLFIKKVKTPEGGWKTE